MGQLGHEQRQTQNSLVWQNQLCMYVRPFSPSFMRTVKIQFPKHCLYFFFIFIFQQHCTMDEYKP